MARNPLAVASLFVLSLSACGSPSEEDVLTADRIRASESAPELPDVQLSENPEPPPAPAPVEEPAENELDNALDGNAIEAGVPGNVPPAFQGLWGVAAADCRPGEVAGNAVLLTGDHIISADTVASLQGVLARFSRPLRGPICRRRRIRSPRAVCSERRRQHADPRLGSGAPFTNAASAPLR